MKNATCGRKRNLRNSGFSMNQNHKLGTPKLIRKMLSPLIKTWLRLVRDVVFAVADMLALQFLPKHRRDGGPTRVVIIILHGIGDFVLWSSAHEIFLRRFPAPDYEITLICWTKAEAFIRAFCTYRRIIAVDRLRFIRDLRYRVRMIRHIRRQGFCIAVQPTFNRVFLIEDSIVRATGAPERIGNVGTNSFITGRQRRISDEWYTRLLETGGRPMHDLLRNAAVLRVLGWSDDDILRPRLAIAACPEPYVLFAIGASDFLRRWPVDRFAALAKLIGDEFDLPIVFVAGQEERELRKDFPIWDGARWTDLIGRTDIEALVGQIACARLLVSNDSGSVHLASAIGTPSVCVVGGGLPGRYHPYPEGAVPESARPIAISHHMPCYGCGWRCIYQLRKTAAAPCITEVTVEEVMAAVRLRLPRRVIEVGSSTFQVESKRFSR